MDRNLPKVTQQEVEDKESTHIPCLLAWDSFQEEILEDEPLQMDVTCTNTHRRTPSP